MQLHQRFGEGDIVFVDDETVERGGEVLYLVHLNAVEGGFVPERFLEPVNTK